MRGLYARGNMLIKYFNKCTMDVKCQLFKTYCTNFYCSSLWYNFNKSTFNAIEVAYKKMFRAFTKVRKGSTYATMVKHNVTTFKALQRDLIVSFCKRLQQSENVLIITIFNSLYFMNSKLNKQWRLTLY